MDGILYLVATPIGNWDDITFRALKIINEADIVVYEEHREGNRLLAHYGIKEKPVEVLNEHNEDDASGQILLELKAGKNIALISDAGTPVLSDPGHSLVNLAIENKIKIIPIPGASSLVPALIVSGFPINEFLFHGFLSPKSDQRIKELRKLKDEMRTIAIMEAPYRLIQLLKDIAEVYGTEREICIAYNLTMPDEKIYRGTAVDLFNQLENSKIKGEFVVVVQGGHKRNKNKSSCN